MAIDASPRSSPAPYVPRSPGFETFLAASTAVLVGTRIDLTYNVTVGAVAAGALLPVWIRTISRYKLVPTVMLLFPAALLSGLLLSVATDNPVFRDEVVNRSALLLGMAVSLGGLLWCRALVGTTLMSILFGAGMVLGLPFNISDGENQWRFTYSIPLTIFLLALASAGRRRLWLQLTAAVGLGLVGLLNDSRSNSAMLLLAAAVVMWQAIDHRLRRGRGGSAMLVVWGLSIYVLIRSAILGGYFGEATLLRTQEQIERAGGSLLLGGRPEIAASVELIQRHPWGMGPGVGTTYEDLLAAKQAMSEIGYDPNNGYVESFLFGRGVEVHSTFGDLWIWFGLAGMALACAMLWVVVRGVQTTYSDNALTVLTTYLATRFLWDLGFSPAASSASLVMLCLTMLARQRDDPGHTTDQEAPDRPSRNTLGASKR